jgi:hypothetical protein
MEKNYRMEIAKDIVKYAKENKIGINRAINRAPGSDRFTKSINSYAKSKRIGVNVAWKRVFSAVSEVVGK